MAADAAGEQAHVHRWVDVTEYGDAGMVREACTGCELETLTPSAIVHGLVEQTPDTRPEPTRADLDARLAAKWHNRDCGCEDPECPVAASSLDRARETGDLIGRALRKRFGYE